MRCRWATAGKSSVEVWGWRGVGVAWQMRRISRMYAKNDSSGSVDMVAGEREVCFHKKLR